MTDQHRATPEQLSMSVYPGDIATDPRKVADAINALSARIEALEAAQLEQAEVRTLSWAIFRRVEALEAAQHAKPNPAWRPLDIETTYGSEAAAATAQQILRAPMVVVEGTFAHGGETYRKITNRIEIEALERSATTPELRAASAGAQPVGGLVEGVRRVIGDDAPCSHSNARAAIREVAEWLRDNDSECQMGGDAAATAELLEQEANRG
jgi:hypothetical protein